MVSDPLQPMPTVQSVDPVADPGVVTTADPATTPSGGDAAKSPLEILEEILGQNPSMAASPAPTSPTQPAATAEALPDSTPPKLSPAEIDALEAAHAAADQAALVAKQAEMASILQTPENQAREAQDEAAQAQKEATQDAMDGYEIKQLDHTKIADQ